MIFYQNMPNLHNRYISAERKISQKNPEYIYNENCRMTTKCLPKMQDLIKINRKYHFSRRQRRKILGQKLKRTQVQRQRRMSHLRSMITYHTKPAKTRNKESFCPVGPVYNSNQVSTEWGHDPINNHVSTEWGYGPITQVSTEWCHVSINNHVSTEWGHGPINNQVSTEWGHDPINNQVST